MPPVSLRVLQSPPWARRLVWAHALAVGAVVLRSLMAVLLVERDRSVLFALASQLAVLPLLVLGLALTSWLGRLRVDAVALGLVAPKAVRGLDAGLLLPFGASWRAVRALRLLVPSVDPHRLEAPREPVLDPGYRHAAAAAVDDVPPPPPVGLWLVTSAVFGMSEWLTHGSTPHAVGMAMELAALAVLTLVVTLVFVHRLDARLAEVHRRAVAAEGGAPLPARAWMGREVATALPFTVGLVAVLVVAACEIGRPWNLQRIAHVAIALGIPWLVAAACRAIRSPRPRARVAAVAVFCAAWIVVSAAFGRRAVRQQADAMAELRAVAKELSELAKRPPPNREEEVDALVAEVRACTARVETLVAREGSEFAVVGACTVRASRDEALDDLAIVRLRVRGADHLDDVADLSHDQVVTRVADAEDLVRRWADRLAVLERRGEHRSPWDECADRAGVVGVQSTKPRGLGARDLADRRAQQALATTAVIGLRLLRDEPWLRAFGMVSFERPEARVAWSRAWHDHLDATRDFLRRRREQGLEPKRTPDPFPLFQARRGHVTRTTTSDEPPVPLPTPPRGLATITRYRSLVGMLGAYVTLPPGGGKRRPAVLWAHDEGQLEPDGWRWGPLAEVVRTFHDAGIVVMVPTWRGENGNRGTRELLYGEVDDLLSARAHLEALPYVDPDRIHLVGSRLGGALVLLAAGESTRFRAAFALDTQPDLAAAIRDDEVDPPFDRAVAQETRLRSPIEFVNHIQRPTYLVHEDWAFHEEADEAAELAPRAPLRSYAVRVGEDDFLVSMARLLARRIAEDDPSVPFELTLEDVQKATAPVR